MRKIFSAFLALLILLGLAGCGGAGQQSGKSDAELEKLEDFGDGSGYLLATYTGSLYELSAREHLPNAEYAPYKSPADMLLAVKSDRADAAVMSAIAAEMMTDQSSESRIIPEPVGIVEDALIFGKNAEGENLCAEFNAYLSQIRESGELEEIWRFWSDPEVGSAAVSTEGLSGERGTLMYAALDNAPPFSYLTSEGVAGIDTDVAARFCRACGYGLEIVGLGYEPMTAGVLNGEYDFGGGEMLVSEERRETFTFSDPVYNGNIVLVTKAKLGPDDLAYYNGKKIGVLGGSLHEQIAEKYFPDSEIEYYNTLSDMAVAVDSGIINGFTCADAVAVDFQQKLPALTTIPLPNSEKACAFAFRKDGDGPKLCAEMSEFLTKLEADGTLDARRTEWYKQGDSLKPVDLDGLTGERVLKLATSGENTPFSYILDGKPAGYEVELAANFCREYGYGLEILSVSSSNSIPGLATGNYDFCADTLVITPERQESVLFSTPTEMLSVVMVVRSSEQAEKAAFFTSLAGSFEKTFVREARWKMILNGIVTTLVISVLSALFGTLLGFGVCMLRRARNRTLCGIASVYIRLLQGTPIVVLLMILYYIVFSGTALDGIGVAVLGFSMNFAAYVSEIMRAGIDGIDVGQWEAALAMGYTKPQTFFEIILPQATENFMPVFRSEIVSLVKSTSIVGYIAVQDLTKAGDLIRSRTYEPFFPLIVTAVIYFILSGVLGMLLQKLERRLRPDRKKRTVKGVRQQ